MIPVGINENGHLQNLGANKSKALSVEKNEHQ